VKIAAKATPLLELCRGGRVAARGKGAHGGGCEAKRDGEGGEATGSEKLCAIAPVARGAGRRVSALNSEAEDRPIAGWAGSSRAARAKVQGTIAPVPIPISAKPATLSAKPPSAATIANPAAAAANDPTMIRWSLDLMRMTSALKRNIAWHAEKNAAPRPAIAASFGASARRSRVDHSKAAVSAAIETPMTIPSPIRAGAKERLRATEGSATVARADSPAATRP
jgi:hypothetical protein